MAELRALEAEITRLRAGNERLRAELAQRQDGPGAGAVRATVQLRLPLGQTPAAVVSRRSPLIERVEPFRSLLRGRDRPRSRWP